MKLLLLSPFIEKCLWCQDRIIHDNEGSTRFIIHLKWVPTHPFVLFDPSTLFYLSM